MEDLDRRRAGDAVVGTGWLYVPRVIMDFREGGTSLVCTRTPKEIGGQDLYSTWTYREIVPMKRIEYLHNLADKDGNKIDPASIGIPADFPQDPRNTVPSRLWATTGRK